MFKYVGPYPYRGPETSTKEKKRIEPVDLVCLNEGNHCAIKWVEENSHMLIPPFLWYSTAKLHYDTASLAVNFCCC